MVNKVMKECYWDRIVIVMGYQFDVELENFLFRNIMEVLLLVNKEDIEVSNLYVMYFYYMFCLIIV